MNDGREQSGVAFWQREVSSGKTLRQAEGAENLDVIDGLFAIAAAINRLVDVLEKVAEETRE